MEYPKVSVIITSYNRFDYLMNAIESVFLQNYPNIEIIVVNDDSDDDRYKNHKFDDIVRVIQIDRNTTPDWGGARKALVNIAAENANGKYLAFLDDDDIWLENKLRTQIELLENSEHKMSSTEGLYGEGVYKKEQDYPLYNGGRWFKFIKKKYKKTKYLNRNSFPEIWDYDFLKIHNCIIYSSVIVEKELFLKLGGIRGIAKNPDYDCWLGLLQLTSSVYVNKPFFYYDNNHGDGREYKKAQ